eukprot:Hpha_TRINITY_DN31176_c0_g1::TRINITY_DN31176_c0_g1_i1::g.33024::m.33024/K03734/apbE; FAD:protein FMN transferase
MADGFTSPTAAMMMGIASPSPPASPPQPKKKEEPKPKPVEPPAPVGPQMVSIHGVRLGMPYTVHVGCPVGEKGAVEAIADAAMQVAKVVFSPQHFYPQSEVATINALPPGERITPSPSMLEVLRMVEDAFDYTRGKFDPTVGPLLRVWEETCAAALCGDTAETCPDVQTIGEEASVDYKDRVGWRKCFKLHENGQLEKLRPSGIDLAGLAKGWCVDDIVRRLAASGYRDVYVDWGGDCRCEGSHPEGRPWKVAVAAPPPLGRLFRHWKKKLPLDESSRATQSVVEEYGELHSYELPNGGALATSGDFGRPWRYGYYGVIDPLDEKLQPPRASEANSCLVSVGSASCAAADAIATALLSYPGPEEARKAAEEWAQAGGGWPEGGVQQLVVASRGGGKQLVTAALSPESPRTGLGKALRGVLRSLPQQSCVLIPVERPECAATVESFVGPVDPPAGRTVAVSLQRPSLLLDALSPASKALCFDARLLGPGDVKLAQRFASGQGAEPDEATLAELRKGAIRCRVVSEERTGDHTLILGEAVAVEQLQTKGRWLMSAHGADGRWWKALKEPSAPPSPAAFAAGEGGVGGGV